jgi:hypothetical protein
MSTAIALYSGAMARQGGSVKAATDVVMVSTRVPLDLAREIKLFAVRNGVSVQQLIREALERQIGRRAKSAK